MELAKKSAEEILENVMRCLDDVGGRYIHEFVARITSARRVFLVGSGRSGLVARAFGMRLIHLGLPVYVVGETTTPPIGRGDALIAISGSGKTIHPLSIARVAKECSGQVIAVTSDKNSPLGRLADFVLIIKGRTKEDIKNHAHLERSLRGESAYSYNPLGTIFESTAAIILDGIIVEMMRLMNKTETDLEQMHANIE